VTFEDRAIAIGTTNSATETRKKHAAKSYCLLFRAPCAPQRHAAHDKRIIQMNRTIKFGLAALAVGAFSILPSKADNTTPDSFTRHGLPIPGAYFKNRERQQLTTIAVSKSERASDKRSRQSRRAGRSTPRIFRRQIAGS
jgi:hypothetical protein